MEHEERRIRAPQLLGRLDKMVEAGRITEEDAAHLRAAADSGELDDAVQDIRRTHAQATVAEAVEDGRLTEEEAAALLERLDTGEHPRFLRHLRRRRPSPESPEHG